MPNDFNVTDEAETYDDAIEAAEELIDEHFSDLDGEMGMLQMLSFVGNMETTLDDHDVPEDKRPDIVQIAGLNVFYSQAEDAAESLADCGWDE